ncbi:MAG: DUF4886 domain-containing protein [Kiritimatiellia bacterium]
MKRILAAIVLSMACLAGEAKALKVLMIGNSFTCSVMRQTPAIAKALGCELDLANLSIGGCPLSRHWANVEKAADGEFRPYAVQLSWTSCDAKEAPIRNVMKGGHANIPQALSADKWDVVTIQQASGQSAFYKTFQPYADNLIAKIRELAPQAEIRIQETWSYCPYDGRLGVWRMTPDTMYEALHESYRTLAKKHGLKIIPTATAVQEFRRRLPVRYAKVLTKKELAALKEPAVPEFYGDVCGKAFWGKGRKGQKDADEIRLHVDPSHFNPEGEYLQGCVWVEALFGKDVNACTYTMKGLSDARAKLMRACAHDVVSARK